MLRVRHCCASAAAAPTATGAWYELEEDAPDGSVFVMKARAARQAACAHGKRSMERLARHAALSAWRCSALRTRRLPRPAAHALGAQ
jgi:hypothetical protein